MADAMTAVASLSYDQTMWNKAIYYPLRPELYYDMFADVKNTDTAQEHAAGQVGKALRALRVERGARRAAQTDADDRIAGMRLSEHGHAIPARHPLEVAVICFA